MGLEWHLVTARQFVSASYQPPPCSMGLGAKNKGEGGA